MIPTEKLQDAYERIREAKPPYTELGNVLLYILLPLIRGNPALNHEYESRVHFYEQLVEDKEYRTLVERIHKNMSRLPTFVDIGKFHPNAVFPKPKSEEYDDILSAKEFYAALSDERQWWCLGEAEQGLYEQKHGSWQAVIAQYQAVLGFLNRARQQHALAEEFRREVPLEIETDIRLLEQRLKEPFYQLHLEDFEAFDRALQENHEGLTSPYPSKEDQKQLKHIQELAESVCRQLLLVTDENPPHEELRSGLEKTRGRPPVAKYESGHILYGKKSCTIPPNSKMARLCDMLLSSSVTVGQEESWVDVYRAVYEHEAESDEDWRKIDGRIRDLNARVGKVGIPPLLVFGGGKDGKVKRVL